MTLTRRGLAEEIDRLDDEIAQMQSDKSEIYKAYREQLETIGKSKPEITDEVTAIKAAIRRRRAIKENPHAVESKDALIDEILVEISAPAKSGTISATRARASRAKARLTESMADTADLAREMAQEGLISEEAAEETVRISQGVAKKLGTGSDEGGAPPSGSPPPQSTPAPAAASAASAQDETTELHVAVEGETGGRSDVAAIAGSALPVLPSRPEWSTPTFTEITDAGLPTFLMRGHPDCYRGGSTGPPEVRPP